MFRNLAQLSVTLLLVFTLSCHATPKPTPPEFLVSEWWNQPYPQGFDVKQLRPQSFIRVKGNQFVDDKDKVVVFRGVNIADPDKLYKQKKWNKALFQELKAWGVNMVRLPVHPVAYRERGRTGYFSLLDQAVLWANQLDMYLILDWHSIGYIETEVFQHPMYDTSKGETLRFWKDMAQHYKGVPTFAVYELFNEPTTASGAYGQLDWSVWRLFNEKMIDLIRASDKTVIPMVAGFNWAYDLTEVAGDPIQREGIAYAIHPYPQKEKLKIKSREAFHKAWEDKWGHLAKTYPMIASEIGWVAADGYGAHIPVKDDGSYGPNIETFLSERGISWTVWCFDPEWAPTMIQDWSFTPTQQGAFFKEVMLEKNRK